MGSRPALVRRTDSMTFLLVEDSRPARNLIKNYVDELNLGCPHRFVEAESAETALLMLQAQGIDFIFIDWNLTTKMTGFDLLIEIRKMKQYKNVPIFMISSATDKVNVIESLKHGANDFIAKPIDQKSFAEKVLKLTKAIKK
jgi:two-component system chemotaxis response regulator CheY